MTSPPVPVYAILMSDLCAGQERREKAMST